MGKVSYLQTSFSAGELSPQLEGRVDLAKYASGTKTLENMVVKSYGGAFRRPGSGFIAEVKDSTTANRLVSFQFSTTQAYVLEFGHLNIRVYYVVSGVPGIVDSGGGVPVDIVTTYDESDLFELQFAQSADVLYITHKDYPPRKLSRTSHTAWTISDITFTWGPFLSDNATTTTLTPSGVAGAITIAASADTFFATQVGGYFRIKLGYVQITGYTNAQLVDASVIETFVAGATTDWAEGAWSGYRGYPAAVSFYEQRLAFAGSTYEPQTIWMSQTDDFENMEAGALSTDALVYTVADNQVNAISWLMAARSLVAGSKGGAFIIGTGDDAPITPSNIRVRKELSYRCAAVLPERIGANVYYLQDDGRVVRELSYDFTTDSFSGANITVLSEHITESGIVEMDYQQSPDNLLWCVREDGEMAVLTRQVEQEVAAWSRMTTDGKYKSVAVIPNGEEDMVWTIVERTIGGTAKKYVEYFKPFDYGNEQEDAFFVDSGLSVDLPLTITAITAANPPVVSCVNTLVGTETIKIRGVVGMTELNNRKFTLNAVGAGSFELFDTAATPAAIDGSLYHAYESGGEARVCFSTVSSLNHINGETVSVLVDGAVHPNRTVVANAITLDGEYSEAHVGLPFTSKIQTLKLETGSVLGAGQGVVKKIWETIVRLYESIGCKIGTLNGTMDTVPFRTSSMPMDVAIPLFTGDKRIVPPTDWGRDCQVYIIQDQPLPLNVLLIIAKIDVSES
jgi:hypothetical protein